MTGKSRLPLETGFHYRHASPPDYTGDGKSFEEPPRNPATVLRLALGGGERTTELKTQWYKILVATKYSTVTITARVITKNESC